MIDYQYIEKTKQLQEFIHYLQSNKIERIAVDFEGEFSLHQYGEELCLIQIFDGTKYFIIDPFKIDKKEIKRLLETRHVMKLFYDAQSDKALVYKKYNIEINSVFDLMDQVHILEGGSRGLDAMIDKYLNVTVSQKKKFQRHNWTLRPIQEGAIQYALQDVQYLFELKETLMNHITDKNLLDPYLQKVFTKDTRVKINPIPGVKRKREYKKLSRTEKEIFDRLFDIRDNQARSLNWPPNNVISNTDLYKIAKGNDSLERSIHPKVPRKSRESILREFG